MGRMAVSAPAAIGAVTKRTARNVAIRSAAELGGKLASFAWILVATRVLSQADLGAFSYALALSLLAAALPAWGFDIVLARRASAEPGLLPRLHSEALAWQTLVAIPVFAITAALTMPGRPTRDAALSLLLLLVAAVFDIWSDTARASAASRQRQGGIATALLVQRFGTAVLAIATLAAGGGLLGLSVAFLAGSAVGWLAHLVALHRLDVRFSRKLVGREGMRDMVGRTWAVGISALILMALFRVDAVILEAFKGDEEVAAYSTAYRLLETVLFVTWSVNHAVFPVMSAGGDIGVALRRAVASVAFVYAPFAAVCVAEAPAILDLLFGEPYATQSVPMLRWLALAPLAYAIAYFGVSALVARDRGRGMVVAALVATAVNVALNLALIPSLGGTGAAVVTTVSYAVEAAVVLVLLKRVRVLAALAETAVAATALGAFLALSPLPLLADLAAGGALYLGVWYVLVRRFAPEQLAVLRSLARRG